MGWLPDRYRELIEILRQGRVEEDIDEEFEHHLALRAELNEANGLAPDAARRAAVDRFGDQDRHRRETRRVDQRPNPVVRVRGWFSALTADIRFGIRSLIRQPALVFAATVSLALGIGVNVTVYALFDAIVFHPFEVPSADRLVRLMPVLRGDPLGSVSVPELREWRDQARTVDVAALHRTAFNWAGTEHPELVFGARVTGDFLSLHGVHAALGRDLRVGDESGAERVALVGERFWRTRLGADPSVVGRPIVLNGNSHTIVGVIPAAHRFPYVFTDIWIPLTSEGADNRALRTVVAVGRLRSGVDRLTAQAEFHEIARRQAVAHPEGVGTDVVVRSVRDDVVSRGARDVAPVLLVAIGFVLLIACANVAGLLLVWGASRSRELGIRVAIGAGRGRLVRQLFTESAIVATLGGIGGCLVAVAGVAWIRYLVGAGDEFIRLSFRVLIAGMVVTGVSAVLFGMLPALKSPPDPNRSLRDGGRSGTSRERGWLRAGLAAGELGLATVLLIAAGLLIKTSIKAQQADLGFEVDHRLVFSIALPPTGFPDSASFLAAEERLVDALRAAPGVDEVGATSQLPLSETEGWAYAVDVAPAPNFPTGQFVRRRQITPSYLEAIGARLIRGRAILAEDRFGARRVALVNEAFVRKHWAGHDPIGRRIYTGQERRWEGQTWEVVGVVGDSPDNGIGSPVPPSIFVPSAQNPRRQITYVIRSAANPEALTHDIRRIAATVVPGIPLWQLQTLRQYVRQTYSIRDFRIFAQLLGAFGAVALLLAVTGVYGVVAFMVAQRTPELSVRRALGAEGRDIVGLVLRGAAGIVVVGTTVGIGLALLLSRGLSRFLFGVTPSDPAIFIGVPVALALAALAAVLIPTRRAVRVDPLVALKAD